MPVDLASAEAAIFAFLRALGRDPSGDPELEHTPARVAKAWATELVDGYEVDVAALLSGDAIPNQGSPEQVIAVRDLSVATVCPHHLLPARGTADVFYRPGRFLAGLGTIARLVDACAHRLALQEAIGEAVARALVEHLGASGAACRLTLSHTCFTARGERQVNSSVQTFAMAGCFSDERPWGELVRVMAEKP